MDAAAELQAGPCLAEVTPAPLSLDKYVAAVADDGAGAIATFLGVTRNSFQGKRTERLEYEAYVPMAAKKLLASLIEEGTGAVAAAVAVPTGLGCRRCCCAAAQQLMCAWPRPLSLQELCQQACAQWHLCKVAIAHRTGTVAVGEASVVIAVSSAHRREALEVRAAARVRACARQGHAAQAQGAAAAAALRRSKHVHPLLCPPASPCPVLLPAASSFPLPRPSSRRPATGPSTSSRPRCPSGRKNSSRAARSGKKTRSGGSSRLRRGGRRWAGQRRAASSSRASSRSSLRGAERQACPGTCNSVSPPGRTVKDTQQ